MRSKLKPYLFPVILKWVLQRPLATGAILKPPLVPISSTSLIGPLLARLTANERNYRIV